jgi:hypothetical protein
VLKRFSGKPWTLPQSYATGLSFFRRSFFLGLSLGNMGRFSEALAVLKEATALL